MRRIEVTMAERGSLAERFEAHRGHLQAVAYRMLGSLTEADDAVQESWLRLSHADSNEIENLGGWLTTVISRVCLDMLRARKSRPEEFQDWQKTEHISRDRGAIDPEHEAMLAESVGLALLVVLDRLAPAERVAFVLHDLFDVPFAEIAPVVRRSQVAAKKLASRARHRIHGTATIARADLVRHQRVVDAFLAAARAGDLNALLEVLDPDVVRRGDRAALPAGAPTTVRGGQVVAEETVSNARRARFAQAALVNGVVGIVMVVRGRLRIALSLAIRDERITEIDVIVDPARLHRLDIAPPVTM
jgi:RNA polymerase sigma factor (sigma-70 family)